MANNNIINANQAKQIHLQMQTLFIKSYLDLLRMGICYGIKRKRSKGIWVNHAPIGYLNIRENHYKTNIIVDKTRAHIIKKLFKEYAKPDTTIKQIVKMAKKMHLTTTRSNSVSRNTIIRMLKNKFYCGAFDNTENNITSEVQHHYGTIISRDLFNQVQAKLNKCQC